MPNYTLADGKTLKNKLGAKTHDELEKLEAERVARRIFEIELGYGLSDQFDAEHLKVIHHHLFQDVYEWAGHTRNERIILSDGTIATEPNLRKPDGQPFLIGPTIPAALTNPTASRIMSCKSDVRLDMYRIYDCNKLQAPHPEQAAQQPCRRTRATGGRDRTALVGPPGCDVAPDPSTRRLRRLLRMRGFKFLTQ